MEREAINALGKLSNGESETTNDLLTVLLTPVTEGQHICLGGSNPSSWASCEHTTEDSRPLGKRFAGKRYHA